MASEKRDFMELALAAAFKRMGRTSPNPAVGAVIVKDGRIISSGGTEAYGCDHAEVCAIKGATSTDLKNADMYVSLEPCSHHGKTPPCVNSIIDSGIKRVYVAILDPNPLVAGKGVEALIKTGIEVRIMHDMFQAGSDLIRQFKKYILRKKPYILNKSAMTLDARIAAASGDSKWISSERSRYIAHRIRNRVDAVIVGKKTFEKDFPSLDVRLDSFSADVKEYFRKGTVPMSGRDNFFLKMLLSSEDDDRIDPVKVIIGLPENIAEHKDFFKTGRHIVYENRKRIDEITRAGKNSGMGLDSMNLVLTDERGPEAVEEICLDLASRGIMFAMLEGGGGVSGSFLDAGETDQFLYFISPLMAGGGTSVISARGFDSISDSLRLHEVTTAMIGDDLLYTAYSEKYNFETA